VVVDLNELDRKGVGLERVEIQPADDTTQIVVGTGGETYESVDARGQRLAQLPVAHNDVAVSEATVTFTVAKSRLADSAYGPENVSLYHREDGSWSRADTELVGETDDSYRFRATADSLSAYTVRTEPPNPRRQPALNVTEASLVESTVDEGEPATVHVVVRNDGEASGSRTVALSVNGVVLNRTTVSLAPGESAAVTFEHAFDRAGTYDVAVGTESFSVQVQSVEEATTSTPSAASATDAVPGFGALPALVALVLALAGSRLLAGRSHP
jgi:PGF-pre-PGF domain-containing protein